MEEEEEEEDEQKANRLRLLSFILLCTLFHLTQQAMYCVLLLGIGKG